MLINRISYYFSMLTHNPLDFVIFVLYEILVISIAFSFHECAHAAAATWCGDSTAKYMGRLTLDPRSHVTLWGTLAIFFLGFGWGKPVPVDARNFRHRRRWLDDLMVSLAGIAANLALFLVSLILALVLNRFLWKAAPAGMPALQVNPYAGSIGTLLAYDGITAVAKELAPYSSAPWLFYIQHFLLLTAMTNLSLAIFNLLPIPPLDGFHLLNDLAFRGRIRVSPQVMSIIEYVLLAVILLGVLSGVMGIVQGAAFTGVTNLLLLIMGQA